MKKEVGIYTLEGSIKMLEEAGHGDGPFCLSLKRALESKNRGDKVVVAQIPLTENVDHG